MGTIKMQNACAALWELEDDPEYVAMVENPDPAFNVFRQRMEVAGMRCLAVAPSEGDSEAEVRELLEELREVCTGKLARFRRFVDAALQEL
jgi:hypothetical protein